MMVLLIVAPVAVGFSLAAMVVVGHVLFAEQLADEGTRCPMRAERTPQPTKASRAPRP